MLVITSLLLLSNSIILNRDKSILCSKAIILIFFIATLISYEGLLFLFLPFFFTNNVWEYIILVKSNLLIELYSLIILFIIIGAILLYNNSITKILKTLYLEWGLFDIPKPHYFTNLPLQSGFPGSSGEDDQKKPYEGKGKGKATEEDLRRMFPEEYSQTEKTKDELEKEEYQVERDAEIAKRMQEEEQERMDFEIAKRLQVQERMDFEMEQKRMDSEKTLSGYEDPNKNPIEENKNPIEENKTPYEGKGKGKATEEDLKRMFPEEYSQTEKTKDELEKTKDALEKEEYQVERDAEIAKRMQERMDFETTISDLEARSKQFLVEHNNTKEKFNKEQNIEKKCELDQKCDDLKELYKNINNDINDLKDMYRSRYHAEPESEQVDEEEYGSESEYEYEEESGYEEETGYKSNPDSPYSEESRPNKKIKRSHGDDIKKNFNILFPSFSVPYFIKNFFCVVKKIFFIIKYLLLAVRSAIPFLGLFLFLGFINILDFINIPEFILVMLAGFIIALKGPMSLWSLFTFCKRMKFFIKVTCWLGDFISKSKFPEFYILILTVVAIYGLAIFFGLSLDGTPYF